MKPSEYVIRIEAPHFTAGVVCSQGRVIHAAPIVRYMVGWNSTRVVRYSRRKGWRVPLGVKDES